jgi:hypothetical protein
MSTPGGRTTKEQMLSKIQNMEVQNERRWWRAPVQGSQIIIIINLQMSF